MTTVLVVLVCGCAVLALWGWGWATARLLRLSVVEWPLGVAFGLAVVVALGGVLNMVGLARGWALDGLFGLGLGLGLWALIGGKIEWPDRATIAKTTGLLAIAVLPALYVIAATVPSTVFDFLDDFAKYFAYPMRMLATGTVAGNTLNSMGAETLGAQAFLDGFLLAHAPLTMINAVDAGLGLVLCAVLVAGAARPSRWSTALASAAVAVLMVVPPQYVNVSTLFLGTALIAALVLALTGGASPIVVGALAATLVALKTTFVPVVALMLLAAAAVLGWRRGAAWLARTGGVAMVTVAPWLLTHRTNLLAALSGGSGLEESPVTPGVPTGDLLGFLSFQPMAYGGSYGAFFLLLLAAVAVAGATLWKADNRRPGLVMAALGLAVAIVYVGQLEIMIPRNFGYQVLRYMVPAICGLLLGQMAWLARADEPDRWARPAALLSAAVAVGLFMDLAPARLMQMQTEGNMLAFHWLARKPDYRAFSTAMVLPDGAQRLRAAQAKVPEGEQLLAWVTTPFHLDYARNPIFDIDYAGLGTPWARLPDARYVMWEFKGFAVTGFKSYLNDARGPMEYVARQGRRALVLGGRFQNAANNAKVLYFDGSLIVFQLTDPLGSYASTTVRNSGGAN